MENLNKYINNKMKKLNNSKKTFKDIFEITHDQDERIFAEITNGYKINKMSYNECKNECIKTALYLEEKLLEVEKNSFVGLMMENSIRWVTTFWGLLMAGYKPVLLNLRLTDMLLNDVIGLTNLKYIVSDKEYNVSVKQLILNEEEVKNTIFQNKEFNWANEIALSTSATSLNIKICVYSGNEIASQIENTKNIVKENKFIKSGYKQKGDIRILAFLPLYHIFGLVATYFWFSFFGRTFVFLKDMANDTITKTVRKHKVTHIFSVPLMWHTIYKTILKELDKKDDKTKAKFEKGLKISLKLQNISPKLGLWFARRAFSEIHNKAFGDSVRFMITGGSYISQEALTLLNGIGYPLYNGYGMSEIGITSVELRKKAKHRTLGTVGKPFKTINYSIDENGCLIVKGNSICKQIITKDKVVDIEHSKWFNTNDNVIYDKLGYYSVSGRIDDVVISSNGEKINPDLIEKKLYLPSVNRYSVIGLNQNNEENLTLILEIMQNPSKLRLKNILKELDKNLAKLNNESIKIEKVYYTYNPIAAETAIKVSRSILKKLIENKKVILNNINELKEMNLDNKEEINSEIALKVKEIMANIITMNKEDIPSDAHFIYDLGATSMDYLTLLVKLREEFEINFDFTNNNNCYNVEEFVKYITLCNK